MFLYWKGGELIKFWFWYKGKYGIIYFNRLLEEGVQVVCVFMEFFIENYEMFFVQVDEVKLGYLWVENIQLYMCYCLIVCKICYMLID